MPEPERRPSPPELDRTTLQAYASTFISRTDQYPLQLPDGRYVSIKKPLSLDHIVDHLNGRATIGAYTLDEHSQARWICLDADTPEQWSGVLNLAADLARQDITAYLEPSRRGGHLWLFFAPLPGADARSFGNHLIMSHNFEDIELYPKQDKLKTGPGSLVRLPLGIHRKSGRRYHFVTLEGEPLAPTIRDQVRLLTSPTRVSLEYIKHTLQNAEVERTTMSPPTFTPATSEIHGSTLSERLKSRISVYDFVRQYVELDERGVGFCPFHDDSHKSFGVNIQVNYWHCWAGCGGGSLIDFWMLWREKHGQDASFTATITELAKMLL